MQGAVFFDVDGTLVPGTSSSQHLAGQLGHLATLRAAEDAYAEGWMDNRQVALIDAAGWKGVPTKRVERLLEDLPLVEGIEEVVAWCRNRGLVPYLATLAWEPVGRYLCRRFDFEGFCGPTVERTGDTYTGAVERHFDEFDKLAFALETAAGLTLPLSLCAAIGDSRSDVPLFGQVGFSIAFNAGPAVQAQATAGATGRDLRAVIPLLDSWAPTYGRQPPLS